MDDQGRILAQERLGSSPSSPGFVRRFKDLVIAMEACYAGRTNMVI
jgi:hypothetical protein